MRYQMEYLISEDTQTLAEVLKEADYATHGFFANRFLIRDLGFSRGLISEFMNDDELTERTLRETETIEEKGLICLASTFGPHQPLRPSEKRRIKYQIDETQLNDGGIGFCQIKMNATVET